MSQKKDPNWQKLLKENFDWGTPDLFACLKDTGEWVESWFQKETVENTPLHRKKKTHGIAD